MPNERLSKETEVKCKGFWRMCGCAKCRAADRQLEKDMKSPEKREAAMQEASIAKGIPYDRR